MPDAPALGPRRDAGARRRRGGRRRGTARRREGRSPRSWPRPRPARPPPRLHWALIGPVEPDKADAVDAGVAGCRPRPTVSPCSASATTSSGCTPAWTCSCWRRTARASPGRPWRQRPWACRSWPPTSEGAARWWTTASPAAWSRARRRRDRRGRRVRWRRSGDASRDGGRGPGQGDPRVRPAAGHRHHAGRLLGAPRPCLRRPRPEARAGSCRSSPRPIVAVPRSRPCSWPRRSAARGVGIETLALWPGARAARSTWTRSVAAVATPAPLAALLRRARSASVVVGHGSATLPFGAAACTAGAHAVRLSQHRRSRVLGDDARPAGHESRVAIRRARLVVAIWPGAADALMRLYGLPGGRVEVVPNGVPAERLHADAARGTGRPPGGPWRRRSALTSPPTCR